MSASCTQCGVAVEVTAQFCAACGSPVAPTAEAGHEVRKVVTVLFADISGSTRLGEQLDPEAVRTLLGRHFAQARAILERHGGTVEKFIGDAVMAVFGIPASHEDDALRAVRAALQLQETMARLNAKAGAAQLAIRIGVNTGEVVTGSGAGETLVTGDTVNTAARLEQAAQPGDILVGVSTFDLTRDAIDAEPVRPIQAKGKAAPVQALRVLRLVGDEGRRRMFGGLIVGRESELEILRGAYEAAATARMPQLITVVAPAGVGKSRLVRELATQLEAEATVARGRCLPYGEGITYWPFRELVHQLAGVDETHDAEEVRRRLATLAGPTERLVDALASLVGLEAPPQRQEELFWAVRTLFERAATDRPLVSIVEDLHWAESTLLDLLEYLVATGRGAVLFIATSRPELLDARTGWGTDAGTLLKLGPLEADTAERLLLDQPGAAQLSAETRGRIITAADGNALFLEEMAAMLRERRAQDDAPDDLTIPPTIHALLAARLDQLQAAERSILEHGSVIGRAFEAPAVAAIGSDDLADGLARSLIALVRRELLRPERADLTDADAYRFRHVLIRDAAYGSLSKARRAELHERFATWLEAAAGERIGEYEAIVAHHLEQALAYRRELAEPDLDHLALRTARWMLRAGLGAARRDDGHAAIAHLQKAAEMGRGVYDVEAAALAELDVIFQERGMFAETDVVSRRRIQIATEAGNEVELARARLNRAFLHRHTEPSTWVDEANRIGPRAIRVLEEAGDEVGLATAWHLMAMAVWPDIEKGLELEERALAHARKGGDPRWIGWTLIGVSSRVVGDETPVSDAIARTAAILDEAASLPALHRASVEVDLAVLEAMDGRYDDALRRVESARETHRLFGHRMELALSALSVLDIHALGGHAERAEAALREAMNSMIEIDEADLRPYLAAFLALLLAQLGRYDEATRMIAEAEVDDSDPLRALRCSAARARILAARGEHEASIAEAQAAVDAVPPGAPSRAAWMLVELAHAYEAAGRSVEAESALRQARTVAAAKGNVALVALIDEQLRAL